MGGRAGGQASQSGACSDGIKEHQVPGGTLLELLRHVEHALLECLPVAVQLHPQSESVCGGEGTPAARALRLRRQSAAGLRTESAPWSAS